MGRHRGIARAFTVEPLYPRTRKCLCGRLTRPDNADLAVPSDQGGPTVQTLPVACQKLGGPPQAKLRPHCRSGLGGRPRGRAHGDKSRPPALTRQACADGLS